MVTADEFREGLLSELKRGKEKGLTSIEIKAGDLHRLVGGYPPGPGESHRMPNCCQVMRSEMSAGDRITMEPPSGQGATLTIRFILPRPHAT